MKNQNHSLERLFSKYYKKNKYIPLNVPEVDCACVIPAWNEENYLPLTIEQLLKVKKDVNALISVAKENNCGAYMLEAVRDVNVAQRELFVDKILKYYGGDIAGKTFAVWGLAFKPKTNDMREAPSITVIKLLLSYGANIQAYDPQAMETAKEILGETIVYSSSSYDAVENADALILLTEWNEFRRPDFEKIKSKLNDSIIFDGRNQFERKKLANFGLDYICI